VLKKLCHINVVKLHEIIDDPEHSKIYLVMDYLAGGTIADKLQKETGKGLPMHTVKKYFRQLVSAVHYCHEVLNIAHRDIKPENLLLDANDDLILCDFGVSQFFKSQEDFIAGTQGTMRFMAPEIVKTGQEKILHGKHVDVWALGVTIYNMMTSEFPFTGKSIIELQH
jgi:serine/threonine protein kinase